MNEAIVKILLKNAVKSMQSDPKAKSDAELQRLISLGQSVKKGTIKLSTQRLHLPGLAGVTECTMIDFQTEDDTAHRIFVS